MVMAALLLVASAGPAVAGRPSESARAREQFRAAQQHYKLAEYPQALDAFKETYRILEDPSLLFNIAQCYRQLNKKEEAIRFYRTYLHDSSNAADREDVQKIIASLEAALKQETAARDVPPQSTLEQPRAAAPVVSAPEPAAEPASAAAPAPAPVLVAVAPTPRHADRPVYKRWWLWTTVGVVVAAGVGVGVGLALTHTPSAPTAATQDGLFHPF